MFTEQAIVVSLMVGSVQKRQKSNGTVFETAIRKTPKESAYLAKLGFEEDDQADKKHHGGADKAVLMFSKQSYDTINAHFKTQLAFDAFSSFGENIVASHLHESSVHVGNQYAIGDAIIEVSQPREPCWKLSENTNNKEMLKFIVSSGLTGWYCRVVQEGIIYENDAIKLVYEAPSELSILRLNQLLRDANVDAKSLEAFGDFEKLGAAFKKALLKH